MDSTATATATAPLPLATPRTDTAEKSGRLTPEWRAYAALAVGVIGITWGVLFVRWAGVPGVASAFYRVFFASMVLVPWWLARTLASRAKARASGTPAAAGTLHGWKPTLVALAGGLFFACDLALFNTAVLRTSATTASLLGNNSPIFVGLGAWLLLRQRPRASFWTGLALALVGCAIIVAGDIGAAADMASRPQAPRAARVTSAAICSLSRRPSSSRAT